MDVALRDMDGGGKNEVIDMGDEDRFMVKSIDKDVGGYGKRKVDVALWDMDDGGKNDSSGFGIKRSLVE